jgi:hypothetical protein
VSKNKNHGWELPHPINLLDHQKSFLRSHYGPPTNRNLKDLPAAARKSHLEASPLAKLRFAEPEWVNTNLKLYEKAIAEDDERAFQELISRDPRYLCSTLGLYFISGWRADLDIYHAVRSEETALAAFQCVIGEIKYPQSQATLKGIQRTLAFEISVNKFHADRARFARINLRHISRSLMKSFDERGHRPVPSEVELKKWYFAAMILCAGLKRAVRNCPLREKHRRVDTLQKKISEIPDEKIPLDSQKGFLRYVKVVASLLALRKPEDLMTVSILSSSPSTIASELVAAWFDVSARTVQKCASSNAMIFWKNQGQLVAILKPPLRLQDYPAAADILRTK